MRYLVVATAVTSLLVLPGRARAESPVYDAGCRAAAPMITATLPANIPGLAFHGSYVSSLTTVSVMASDGTTIPTTLSLDTSDPARPAAIVAFSTALQPDKTYTITWNDECATGNTKTFTTTAAAPLPTAAGSITVSAQIPPTSSATCIGGKPTWPAMRNVIFTEDPALIPFLPIAKIDLIVDGSPETARTYGQFTESDSVVGALSNSCPGATTTPRLVVRVRLANGPTLNTSEMTTELRCLETLPGGCPMDPVIDGGVDSSIGDATATDTATPADTATEPDARQEDTGTDTVKQASDSGCALNSARTESGLAGLALALLASLVVRRRVRSE